MHMQNLQETRSLRQLTSGLLLISWKGSGSIYRSETLKCRILKIQQASKQQPAGTCTAGTALSVPLIPVTAQNMRKYAGNLREMVWEGAFMGSTMN